MQLVIPFIESLYWRNACGCMIYSIKRWFNSVYFVVDKSDDGNQNQVNNWTNPDILRFFSWANAVFEFREKYDVLLNLNIGFALPTVQIWIHMMILDITTLFVTWTLRLNELHDIFWQWIVKFRQRTLTHEIYKRKKQAENIQVFHRNMPIACKMRGF